MLFKIDDKSIALSLDNPDCKLTKGLHTTLYLSGLGFWNLQPKFAFMFGGAEAFCRAWAIYMRVPFDGNCEEFYKHFDFDLIEKAEELTKFIHDLVDRDIERVEEKKLDERRNTKKPGREKR